VGRYDGVYKSADGGKSWSSFSAGLTSTDVQALAINPVNPNRVYAGTSAGGAFKSVELPSIISQPASQTITAGQTATLHVVADGAAPLRYQWYQGNRGDTSTPIAGATANSFTALGLTSNASYWVRITNADDGSIDSGAVTVTVITQLRLSAPISGIVGKPFDITVTALDSNGSIAAGYKGRVHFTSSDSQAILPSDYTFAGNDNGMHTFSTVLKTVGDQSIGVADISNSLVKDTHEVSIATSYKIYLPLIIR
jgi:hypothetical protein